MLIERQATGGWSLSAAGGTANTITYDSVTQSYIVKESNGPTLTFTADERVAAQSNDSFTVYRDTASGTEFRQLNNSPTNPKIALTYASYGTWVRPTPIPTGYVSANSHVYVVYGQGTEPAAMPRTGTATYSAIIDGTYNARAGLYALSGDATFSANFGQGTIGLQMTPIATLGSNSVNLGSLNATGTISGAAFNASNGYSGPYLLRAGGRFFGPTAQEIGAAFSLSGLPTSSLVPGGPQIGPGAALTGGGGGVLIGKRN
jgi:hypothetical protein